MGTEPIIPKLRYGRWSFHSAKDGDGNGNGSVLADVESGTPYCIAKQPRYVSKEEWETHARCMSKVPDMLKYLIELRYQGIRDRKISMKTIKEVDELLKEVGCYDEDIW